PGLSSAAVRGRRRILSPHRAVLVDDLAFGADDRTGLLDDGPAPAVPEPDRGDQADQPGQHQHVADDIDVNATELRIDGEREDRPQREKENASADAHRAL